MGRFLILMLVAMACVVPAGYAQQSTEANMSVDENWKQRLSGEQHRIMNEGGTEAPGSSPLLAEKRAGGYYCAQCGTKLFESTTKFDSGTGWPSFTDPADRKAVTLIEDNSHGMRRTEVRCAKCGGHLGHVFPDGPGASGERFCINGAALQFTPEAK